MFGIEVLVAAAVTGLSAFVAGLIRRREEERPREGEPVGDPAGGPSGDPGGGQPPLSDGGSGGGGRPAGPAPSWGPTSSPPPPGTPDRSTERLHVLRISMQILVTVVGLGTGFYILMVGGYSAAAENVASGLIGSVIGFWLK